MDNQSYKDSQFRNGITSGIPIMIGYLPIAMAFGMLAKTTGISMLQSFMFSACVYAGASQFMALNMIAVGAGPGEIILATLLVNFRHFLMSASLAARIKADIKKYVPFIAFGNTDEVFSIISLKSEEPTKEFMLALELMAYASWVGGTVLGYFVGELLPPVIGDSMPIALYAMFIAILTPEVKKSIKAAALVLLSGALNTFLGYMNALPSGWNMIVAILISSTIGVYMFRKEDEVDE